MTMFKNLFNLLLNKDYRKYRFILVFFLTQYCLLSSVMLLIHFKHDKFPAPKLSSSLSFNEKARWLSQHISKCDILVGGSSVALNNIDWSDIQSQLYSNIINVSSWGLSLDETAILLDHIAAICTPKLIVLPIFYADFFNKSEKGINWQQFDEYITHKKPDTYFFYENLDLLYYFSSYFDIKKNQAKQNTIYETLQFDNTGSVLYNCQTFEKNPIRWNGYKILKKISEAQFTDRLSVIAEISAIATKNNSKLLIVLTPLREVAEQALQELEVDKLWEQFNNAIVKTNAVTVVNSNNLSHFSDDNFADYAHLNSCGAKSLAQVLLPVVNSTLPPPQLSKTDTEPNMQISSADMTTNKQTPSNNTNKKHKTHKTQ